MERERERERRGIKGGGEREGEREGESTHCLWLQEQPAATTVQFTVEVLEGGEGRLGSLGQEDGVLRWPQAPVVSRQHLHHQLRFSLGHLYIQPDIQTLILPDTHTARQPDTLLYMYM